jgi:hypothetical protein
MSVDLLSYIAVGLFAGALGYLGTVLGRSYQWMPIEQEMLLYPVDPMRFVPTSWVGTTPRNLSANNHEAHLTVDSPDDQTQQMVKHIGDDYRIPPPALIGKEGIWINKVRNNMPMINENI